MQQTINQPLHQHIKNGIANDYKRQNSSFTIEGESREKRGEFM